MPARGRHREDKRIAWHAFERAQPARRPHLALVSSVVVVVAHEPAFLEEAREQLRRRVRPLRADQLGAIAAAWEAAARESLRSHAERSA